MATSPIRIGAPGTVEAIAWRNPAIEIDEDYWGTYHLEKNISLEVPYKIDLSSRGLAALLLRWLE